METACEVRNPPFHAPDLPLELILFALEAVSLRVDHAAESADEADQGLELVAGPFDVFTGGPDAVAEFTNASFEAPDALGQEVASVGRGGHWK